MKRLTIAREEQGDDEWDKVVDSWNIPPFKFKKNSIAPPTVKNQSSSRCCLRKVPNHNNDMDSCNYYLHPWKKGYKLLHSKNKSISTYPVELVTIDNLEMIKSLNDKRIRQFCLYDGTFYSGEIRKNKASNQETYIFRFHEDGDCEIKFNHLDNIRIQIIKYGRRPQK